MQQPKFSQELTSKAASFTIPNASGETHRNMVPYKDNDDIRTLVRRAAVLSLLPPDTVKYVWFQAQEDIDDTDINIIIYRVNLGQKGGIIAKVRQVILDIMRLHWVARKLELDALDASKLLDRDLWNHHATGEPRATNHLEGWDGKLKKLVKAPHPNIFNMVKLLKHEEAVHACTLLQYQAVVNVSQRQHKYREIDSRLTTLKTRL
ncbi:LOW QUALITY PROTEIN: hypothetical protein KUTeg_011589 [Tegillarca granosa]|uniref:Uncharacterized protein n=1 Tax=Tegillarca granosa TaxID=220873 RepID=A0ABQ9EX26_TEGGR|nr:LOW QUALITY PROTEIN: hypothetical protein KUTeg_011589 [Tegillarca granosa]